MAQGQQQARQRPQRQTRQGKPKGLPPDLKLYTPFPFKGVNLKASVIGIEDQEFAWLENVIWIGEGRLSILLGVQTNLYSATGGKTIISYWPYNIATIQYLAVFLSDGSAVQVQVSVPAGAITTIAPAATFNVSDVNRPPIAKGWQGKWLVIGDLAGYYIWDGTSFFKPGTLGPEVTITNGGSSYASAPTVTIFGGAGTGATATSSIIFGSVVSVRITNPGTGYAPGDLAKLVFAFTGGGSTNAIAQGTATIGAGGVTSYTVTNGGTGYTTQPTVTITLGGGAGATAVAVGNASSITSILVVTPGSGYTSNPTVTVSAPAGGGATATAIANIGINGVTAISVAGGTNTGGSGYTGTPTVVITDPTGSGTGATAVANMNAGVVASVTITNPGANYLAAVVTFVGGNPAVATATGSIMPQGGLNPVSGAALEVFQNRIWLANVTNRFTSAPNSVTLFSASSGGVISQNTDNSLQFAIFAYQQSQGFLYEFGDTEINAISNPQTTASATTATASTSYTVTNVDPQEGCYWPETIQPFGQGIIFTRADGVWAVYGSKVEKVSTKIDHLFATIPIQTIRPSAAIVLLQGIKFYAVTLLVLDPVLMTNRQLILLWDGFRWYFATQPAPAGATVKLRSIINISGLFFQNQFAALGSDGTNIYQCFSVPSATLQKKIISKFYGADNPIMFKQVLRWYLSCETTLTYTLNIHSDQQPDVVLANQVYPDIPPAPPVNTYSTNITVQGRDGGGANGTFLGWTLTTTTAQATIEFMGLGYREYSGYYS